MISRQEQICGVDYSHHSEEIQEMYKLDFKSKLWNSKDDWKYLIEIPKTI